MFEKNGPYSDDLVLLKALGLPVWSGGLHEKVFVGEVRPYAAEENPAEQTVIRIYVTPAPAQFYRFEIIRKIDAVNEEPGMETLEISTGSGSLAKYWQMVLAVASNCFDVKPAKRLLNS